MQRKERLVKLQRPSCTQQCIYIYKYIDNIIYKFNNVKNGNSVYCILIDVNQ